MVEMYKKVPPKQCLVPRSTYIAGLPTANWISQALRALRVHTRLHMRLTEMRRTVDTGFVFVCLLWWWFRFVSYPNVHFYVLCQRKGKMPSSKNVYAMLYPLIACWLFY